ncbi:hypothetical protein CU669_04420 [Paramagnetospirillum kuznetsovii]|uniref:Uncharacterized protein n=1 Tax=Paramagnetospirillum kuznetsovii TaxID=2053833 RepID=A0A364P217_9PROT|nr:hypothetical protein [Paramagnetospirillum kuznetsovii]RAU23382.1 hypothetical protein CU669_04420 [Paramagnetospirillum kuznetsovii]
MTDDIKHPEETVTTLAVIDAPWSREITLQKVEHDSGLGILRMRIKEGRARFTIIDLDQPTVDKMMGVMGAWSGR